MACSMGSLETTAERREAWENAVQILRKQAGREGLLRTPWSTALAAASRWASP